MQTASSRIWIQVSDFISYDDNCYALCASQIIFKGNNYYETEIVIYIYPMPQYDQGATQGHVLNWV